MNQSRVMSMVEAATNVVVGYVLAIATQIVVFPWFGIETGLAEHMTIGLVFVGVSLVRGYLFRRMFEAIRVRSLEQACFSDVRKAARIDDDTSITFRCQIGPGPRHPSRYGCLVMPIRIAKSSLQFRFFQKREIGGVEEKEDDCPAQ